MTRNSPVGVQVSASAQLSMEPSNGPRVSIVLPTYNGAAYLAESVQSCLDQTFTDFELIVVDDASTDATPTLLSALAARDPRIRVVRHETNRRLPAALNTGFALARGDYLTWTSDDNRYLPTALAELVQALEQDALVDYMYADVEVIDESGRVVEQAVAMEPQHLLTGHEGLGLACFLYRRRVYERLGGYAEDLFLAEDYEYWLRVLRSGMRMVHLHRTLYQYRRHARSLTDAHRGRTFLAAERALTRQLHMMTELDRSLRGRAYLYLASLATWRRAPAPALWYLLQAACYAPGATLAHISAFVGRRVRSAISARSKPIASA